MHFSECPSKNLPVFNRFYFMLNVSHQAVSDPGVRTHEPKQYSLVGSGAYKSDSLRFPTGPVDWLFGGMNKFLQDCSIWNEFKKRRSIRVTPMFWSIDHGEQMEGKKQRLSYVKPQVYSARISLKQRQWCKWPRSRGLQDHKKNQTIQQFWQKHCASSAACCTVLLAANSCGMS